MLSPTFGNFELYTARYIMGNSPLNPLYVFSWQWELL